MIEDLGNKLDFLFEPKLIEEIKKVGKRRKFKEGEAIITIGQRIQFFPIIIEGSIKILRENDEGQELLLYYLEPGDTCSMTLQCCLGQSKSKIIAVAEIPTDLVLVPVKKMEEWVTRYAGWRQYVFNSYQERINELLQAVDNLAFLDLESRLKIYLKDKLQATGSEELNLTHQKIATELNTSRVVISRLMKKLEKNQQIRIERKSIHLIE